MKVSLKMMSHEGCRECCRKVIGRWCRLTATGSAWPHSSVLRSWESRRLHTIMKHRVAFRKLNRTSAHRWAMLRTQVTQLVEHERIRTTLPKAKELRRVADQVVTMAKQGDLSARKRAESVLRTPAAVDKLFNEFATRYAAREGGYTRVVKADFRKGDGAEMAIIEYVDRPGEIRKAKLPKGLRVVLGEEQPTEVSSA